MANEPQAAAAIPAPQLLPLKDFLENIPPGSQVQIDPVCFDVKHYGSTGDNTYPLLNVPELLFHCGTKTCDGPRFFKPRKSEVHLSWRISDVYLDFDCKNCDRHLKTISVRFDSQRSPKSLSGFKFGEIPQFGPPLPARLLRLAGSEARILKKGRQSENQSLGIGAFAYYRRVVELQKVRLIEALKSAVGRLGADKTVFETLEAARQENQFTKALEMIASVLPKELFINGRNPLTLLHGPLSVGLHSGTDEECLKRAHNIRIVLTALMERIEAVTEDEAELDAAIKELLGE